MVPTVDFSTLVEIFSIGVAAGSLLVLGVIGYIEYKKRK